MSTIIDNIATVRTRIRQAEQLANRPAHSVTLMAASKTKSVESIRQAFMAGVTDFGENYVQEALDKMLALQNLDITWHYIGHIQTNKTRSLAENFAWVHTVDRQKIAQRLHDQRPEHLPPLNICLEVNVDNEPSKSGVSFDELPALADSIANLPRLRLRGLMAIPKASPTQQEQQASFASLRTAFDKLKQTIPSMDTLSIGMSSDLEAAIAAGSTIVRVGTDIFGARDYAPLSN
jgi:PLP dependent protein